MVTSLSIHNFKSIREANITLQSVNVLVGANGAGKSNFIGFFTLLKAIYERKLQSYVAGQAGAENILYFGRKQSDSISGRIEFDVTNDFEFELSPDMFGRLYFSLESNGFNKEFQHPPRENWSKVLMGEGHLEAKLGEYDGGRYHHIKKQFENFIVYHFHDTSMGSKIRQKGNLDDNQTLMEDGRNLAAYLFFLQEKHPKVFRIIERNITSVAPFFERFNLQPDRLRNDYIQLEWKEKDSEFYFNASHLSDGTLRFIALCTLLLQPQPPKTIIIDEPELGLHPFAIAKLAGLIHKASLNSQIIISTQSVSLVEHFTPEQIVTVDRKDSSSVFSRLDTDKLKIWLEEYTLGELWDMNIIGARP